ncbi:uncharacterized protein LOC132753269 isoform X2 [Ruditapes philippinarum]|uniref:uncharacterized protein LOC132753269 isoform X2 n=1 Tax=Ruditapes philippinarum TaxID=129788 RepID=UPI00295B32E9|nr:uncharacterized protein LOC132753269 isoform X2 [Ruditapes philippinarum]
MNNQTTERIKESLVSSNPRGASGSDLLSVRGPNSKDESDLLSALKIKDDSESLAEISFAGDDDENIKDPCAVCFTNRNFSRKATHFCNDCGLLGHFLCEQCLGFHKTFTNHKSVKSFVAAKYKRGSNPDEALEKKASEIDALQKEVKDLKSKLSNHDEALEKKASEIDTMQKEVKDLRSKLEVSTDDLLIANAEVNLKRSELRRLKQKFDLDKSVCNRLKQENAILKQ